MKLFNVLVLSIFLVLSACSSSSDGGSSDGLPVGGGDNPTTGLFKVVDSSGEPVNSANVSVTSKNTGIAVGGIASGAVATLSTDANGSVALGSLSAGDYQMKLDDGKGNPPVIITLKVDQSDKSGDTEEPVIIIPAIQNSSGEIIKIGANVAALSGNISDATGQALEKVSVSLTSSGLGTLASSTTNAEGAYTLLVNVSNKSVGALGDLTLTVSLKGYKEHKVNGLQVVLNTSVSGFDFSLTPLTTAEIAALNALIVTSYDFSSLVGWSMTGLWHQHTNSLSVKNAALATGWVDLAPNDTSLGFIPDTFGSNEAMWFGSAAGQGDVSGNFLGAIDTYSNSVNDKNGGTSNGPISGSLTSPDIVLPTTGPLSLTFDTWWEIESVNPNASGFDLMTVQYSTDSGITWVDLARFNPLADPVTDVLVDRASVPYSNNGFNTSPSWVKQERIPLVDPNTNSSLAGQTIQLRFSFDTVDSLFNGFRGWLVDDVEVAKIEGTFPVMDPYSLFINASVAQSWDWAYLAWNPVTGAESVIPNAWTSLPAGVSTNISGTFEYETSLATQAQLAFSIDGGTPVAVASSNVTLTAGPSINTVVMSANVIPVSGSYFVELWVQMLDSQGNVVMEMPVTGYTVQ